MHIHPQVYIDVSFDHTWTRTIFLKVPVVIMKIPIIKVPVSGVIERRSARMESEQLKEHVHVTDKNNYSEK